MEQFYIELIEVILHFSAAVYCIIAVFKRWGYYWILPALSSLLFFISALRSAFTASSQEIILTGTRLLFSSTSALGALVWFFCLIILHKILINKKEDYFSKKIFPDDSSTIFYPVRPENSVLLQSKKEESTLAVKNKSNQSIIPTPFYFFGLKHCGKSTLGRLTAQALSMSFLDADDILSSYLGNNPGYESMTIRELYRIKGKNRFQEYEYLSMFENLKSNKSINYIYALGGGACDNTRLLQYLKQTMGTFFYIKQDEKVLLHRILKNGIPPFLDSKNPKESFHKLFSARSEIYKELADHIIDISGDQSIEDSVRMIIIFLNKLKAEGK